MLEGAIVIGSFAAGTADGRFEKAWAARRELEGAEALVAWDDTDPADPEIGARKWLTRDIVLVECLVATPASGVKLAEPFRVVAGGDALPCSLARRPPIACEDVDAFARDLEAASRIQGVERAYHALVETVRSGREAS